MELQTTEFFVLKGKKQYIFGDEKEAIAQIKKDRDTDCQLIRVDISGDKWELMTVEWSEIAKHLMG